MDAQKTFVSIETGSNLIQLGPPFLPYLAYVVPWSLVVSAYKADSKMAHWPG